MPPRKKAAKIPGTKLFVLGTNVLLHDPTSLFRFEEHDICLPMFVLEELDNKKKGMTEVARNPPHTRTAPVACSCKPASSNTSCRKTCSWAKPTTRSSGS